MNHKCEWKETDFAWAAECGKYFVLNCGTPHENDMIYCCYCGGDLIEKESEDEH